MILLENEFGIIICTGLHCAPLIHHYIGSSPKGTARISPSSFTKAKESRLLIDALMQICKMTES